MTPPSHPEAAWQRLGDLLMRRRVDDLRLPKRSAFCETTGLDYRVVADIERARRTNFSAPMIVALETGYQLKSGNIGRILQGGEVEPATDQAPHAREVSTSAPDDDIDLVALELFASEARDYLGDLRDGYERRIAAIQNAPFEQRLKAILIYRQVVEADAQNAGRPAVEQADRGRRSSRGA